jgi:hypothetical protein
MNHVHLISGHRLPLLPQLTIDQAFRYLLDAPTIVKQTAPMAWTYVTAPQDGTLWLEWISPRNDYRFPSDGYVWGDPEQPFQQDFGGYTIEILRHSVGFRPGFDQQMATHARTRYHFRTKNPNVAAAHPDSHLWIVHYHQTDQNHMMPIQSLQLQPVMRQILNERKWLESLGRLERKDFMLHDREHWPQINLPGSAPQQQGMYGNPMMQQQMNQQRFPQYPYAQGQGPPAKRPRHSGPSGMPGSADGVPDTSIEDEENTSLGDFFDHLSPREISMMRYMQHHRWMEEVFSSPYASSQIVPPDLGLGLMGELKGLTEGILDPPSSEEIGRALEKPNQAKEAQPFTNLKKEQLDEFNKRVEKHLEDGRAEIERMKREHAEKMAEWKKTKMLMQAEKRLRNATWEGHESAVPVYRLDVGSANGHVDETAATETVEDVVKNVESAFGVRIESHKESNMVEKGGLDEEQQREEPVQEVAVAADTDMSGMQQQEPMMSGANKVEPEPQSNYQQQIPPAQENAAQTSQPQIPVEEPESSFEMDEHQDFEDEGIGNEAGEAMDQSALDDLVDMGDTSLIDGMDMDVDTGGMEFIEDDQTPGDDMAAAAAANVPGMADELATPQQDEPLNAEGADVASTATSEPSTASPVTLGEAGEQEAPAPDESLPTTTTAPPLPVSDSTALDTSTIPPAGTVADLGEHEAGLEGAAAAADIGDVGAIEDVGDVGDIADAGDVGGVADNSLFDDTFDDLTNMDGGADDDDGLIDFDGGMGMEESAFGDAMHGMDTNTPLSGLGQEQDGV